jgi:hypothetical protein
VGRPKNLSNYVAAKGLGRAGGQIPRANGRRRRAARPPIISGEVRAAAAAQLRPGPCKPQPGRGLASEVEHVEVGR